MHGITAVHCGDNFVGITIDHRHLPRITPRIFIGDALDHFFRREALFQQRAEPAFEDWLNSLRGRAYIDNRLDPESSTRRR